MMQRWREKLKYIEAGLIVTSLIMFVVSLFVDYENTGLEAAILIIGTAGSDRVYSRNRVVFPCDRAYG